MITRVLVVGAYGVDMDDVRSHLEAFVGRLPGAVELVTIGGEALDWDVESWALDNDHGHIISFANPLDAVDYVKGNHVLAFTVGMRHDERVADVLAHARKKRKWYWKRKQQWMHHKITITVIEV